MRVNWFMEYRLCRILITGGSSFQLYPQGNPVIEHGGGTSVHNVYMSPSEVEDLVTTASKFGSSAQVLEPIEQTKTQKKERLDLLGVEKGQEVWPSVSCPECAWFEPTASSPYCGRNLWPKSVVDSYLELPKSKKDLSNCPVPEIWG